MSITVKISIDINISDFTNSEEVTEPSYRPYTSESSTDMESDSEKTTDGIVFQPWSEEEEVSEKVTHEDLKRLDESRKALTEALSKKFLRRYSARKPSDEGHMFKGKGFHIDATQLYHDKSAQKRRKHSSGDDVSIYVHDLLDRIINNR